LTFGVQENNGYNGNLSFTDNGDCGFTSSTNPVESGTIAYASIQTTTISISPSGASDTCVFTVSDGTNSSSLAIDIDQPNLTISNKARKQ
jgi:hypothetical protein